MTAFAAGFLLDLLIGDPYSLPHPVRWIGRLIGILDKSLLGEIPPDMSDPDKRDRASERTKGAVTVLIVITVILILSGAVMLAAYRLSMILGMAIEAVLTCSVLAATSLRRESMKVYCELEKGDIEGARKAVSMIVGRDTACLDETGITRAAVETVAENLSDGEIAPMMYAAVGGPVLGLIYKAINTMDSMIGYRNDRYMWFGTAAAKLDDAVNYIPSRISAWLLILSAAISGREYDAKRAYAVWKRDRYRHKSPNAAQTESACAGALGVVLAGDASYFGKKVHKPTMGDPVRAIETEDIKRANRLMLTSSVLGELICLAVMYLIMKM
jgi:adenosylcobinamide-phosphate synthase